MQLEEHKERMDQSICTDAGHSATFNEDCTDNKVYNFFSLFFKIIINYLTSCTFLFYINAFHALYLLYNDIQSKPLNSNPS